MTLELELKAFLSARRRIGLWLGEGEKFAIQDVGLSTYGYRTVLAASRRGPL